MFVAFSGDVISGKVSPIEKNGITVEAVKNDGRGKASSCVLKAQHDL